MINLKRILNLMEKYEENTGKSIVMEMFSDGSGNVSFDGKSEIDFEFDDIGELDRKLTLKAHWRE